MNYWILQHNRNNIIGDYRYPSGIPPNRGCWAISRYVDRVSFGDVAFIWYTGADRGIYNVSTIVSVPPHSAEYGRQVNTIWGNLRRYFDPEAFRRIDQYPRILVDDQYSNDFEQPLTVEELTREGFGELLIIRMPRWGIYSLDYTVGKRLLEYIWRTRGRG